jgi:hypothetical protein
LNEPDNLKVRAEGAEEILRAMARDEGSLRVALKK